MESGEVVMNLKIHVTPKWTTPGDDYAATHNSIYCKMGFFSDVLIIRIFGNHDIKKKKRKKRSEMF